MRNWTRNELADTLAVAEQQVQRCEATHCKGVAVERPQAGGQTDDTGHGRLLRCAVSAAKVTARTARRREKPVRYKDLASPSTIA